MNQNNTIYSLAFCEVNDVMVPVIIVHSSQFVPELHGWKVEASFASREELDKYVKELKDQLKNLEGE